MTMGTAGDDSYSHWEDVFVEAPEEAHLPWESIDPADVRGGIELQPSNATSLATRPTSLAGSDRAARAVTSIVRQTQPAPQRQPDADEVIGPPVRGGGLTIPLLCAGIGLIACCIIIPQADQNRRAAYEKLRLENDLASIRQQVTVNDEFLKRVEDDPTLAERLAERQLNMIREGSRVWHDRRLRATDAMSPFTIVNVPKPAPLPDYQPFGGSFAQLCRDAHSRLYLIGAGMLMMAAGLVLGANSTR